MAADWDEVPIDWSIKDIGAHLLHSLAQGLYGDLEVLREYVQNAVDSYVDFQQLTGVAAPNTVQVWVDEANAAVHVMDDGVGMDLNDLMTAKAIAVSPKLSRPLEFVGFRGLGIWSGLQACDELVLRTSKIEDPWIYRLRVDCRGIVEHLDDPISIDELLKGRFQLQRSAGDLQDHYTQVKLVNVHRDRYNRLLSVGDVTRFAEQYLPVPFDPEWPHAWKVVGALSEVLWTGTYSLMINGKPVYRRLPSEIKDPEVLPIKDSEGRDVAIAWLCETDRRGPKKALDVTRGGDRNFAVRVKNFTIGHRGLYSELDVPDHTNLDWFVGEIYVTDTDIKPDTKRLRFEPSARHDDVIFAIRRFYTSVALRARGWSLQVTVEDSCKDAVSTGECVERLLADSARSDDSKQSELQYLLADLARIEQKLREAQADANKADTSQDAESSLIQRRYLRKQAVRQCLTGALGKIAAVRRLLEQEVPTLLKSDGTSEPSATSGPPGGGRRGRSRARTVSLRGKPISNNAALTTQAIAGTLPGFDKIPSNGDNKGQLVDLNTAIQAFAASLAAVLGEENENFRRVMDRLPTELRRRGVSI